MARQYAPAMSKQAFKLARPKGSYQAYLGYLQRHRPGWKPPQAQRAQHVPPPMRGPLPNYESLLRSVQIQTPQQMEAQANRMAQTQLGYQKSLMQEEYKRAQDDALRRMQAFAAAGREAAAMNASLIGQVGGQYQAGADQLNAMAAGGAGMMAGATAESVAAANNALGNVGAPALSVGGPVGAPGIAGATQAGVESYRGGALPAAALQNAGGYAQAGMAGQISSQNLRATQEAQAAYMQTLGEADRNRATAIKEMAAGRPQVAMQYLQQLQDNQRQAIALASSLVGAGFEKGMVQKEYKQKVKQQAVQNQQWAAEFGTKNQQWAAEYKLKAQQVQQAAKLAQIGLNQIDASASSAWGYLVNRAGQPIRKNGKLIPVAGGTSSGTSGLTPYQASRLMEKADTAAQKAAQGKTDSEGNVTGVLRWPQTIGKLTTMGLSKAQAQAIARNYYDPGVDGAPAFWPEEVKWAKKKYGHLFGRAQQTINALNEGDDPAGYDIADRIRQAIISGLSATEVSQLVLEGKNRLR